MNVSASKIWNQSNQKKIVLNKIRQIHLPHCSRRYWNELVKQCNL